MPPTSFSTDNQKKVDVDWKFEKKSTGHAMLFQ